MGPRMTYQTLLVSQTDGLAVITLDRPEVMNALNTTLRRELRDAIGLAIGSARALVLTGAGRAFCSGQDLSDSPVADLDLEAVRSGR